MFDRVLKWLGRAGMTPLERKLLDALMERLDAPVRAKLSMQIEQINLVQRHAHDKEVNFYSIKHRESNFDEQSLFPAMEEAKLAIITFRPRGQSRMVRASVWMAKGHLFSIEFSLSPRDFDDNIEVVDVEVLLDPMSIRRLETVAEPQNVDMLTGWLREWVGRWTVMGVSDPLQREQREQLIERIAGQLPDDYIELITQTEGLWIDGCHVLGLAEIREVVMADANYYVLAEITSRGVLAAREGSLDGQVYYLSYEENLAEAVGTSFRAAIESMLMKK